MNKNELKRICRSVQSGGIVARSQDNGERIIEGYALLFDVAATPYKGAAIYETITKEAITEELISRSDIIATIDHRPDTYLARCKYGDGGLELTIDDKGLKFRFEVPDTADGKTAYELVRRGIIDGCSFSAYIAFGDPSAVEYRTGKDADGNDAEFYTIRRIEELCDVALTPHPANSATECVARHRQTTEQTTETPQTPNQAMKKQSLTLAVRNALRSGSRHFETRLVHRQENEDGPTENPGNLTGGVMQPTGPGNLMATFNGDAVDSSAVTDGGLKGVNIQQWIDGFVKNTVYEKCGCPVKYSASGDLIWPVVGQATAQILGETEEIAPAKLDVTNVKMPKERVAVQYNITYSALNDSDNVVEDIVRAQLSDAVRRCINNVLLSDSADKGSLRGVEHAPYIDLDTVGTDNRMGEFGVPTLAALAVLKAKVVESGLDVSPVFVLHPALAARLEYTPVNAGSGRMIMENGMICGCPVVTDTAMPETNVLCGDFAYQPCAFFGDSTLIVDPYTEAGRAMVRFILNVEFGTVTLRPEAFALGSVE